MTLWGWNSSLPVALMHDFAPKLHVSSLSLCLSTGKGTWSGYGARPRGKGIVDQCCRPSGCELQHLELYCAKPKSQPQTTAYPSTTLAPRVTAQQDTVINQLFERKRSLKTICPSGKSLRISMLEYLFVLSLQQIRHWIPTLTDGPFTGQ